MFRLRVPDVVYRKLTEHKDATGESYGIAAYSAVVAHRSEVMARLKPRSAPAGMPAPRTGRYYQQGGSPQIDLYLAAAERDSVVALAAELGVAPSKVFREALVRWAG